MPDGAAKENDSNRLSRATIQFLDRARAALQGLVPEKFRDPIYNAALWCQVAHIDEPRLKAALNAVDEDGMPARYMPLQIPDQCTVDVARNKVTVKGEVKSNIEAVEAVVRHAMTSWKGGEISVGGDSDALRLLWAVAVREGVKIVNVDLVDMVGQSDAKRREKAAAILDEYRTKAASQPQRPAGGSSGAVSPYSPT